MTASKRLQKVSERSKSLAHTMEWHKWDCEFIEKFIAPDSIWCRFRFHSMKKKNEERKIACGHVVIVLEKIHRKNHISSNWRLRMTYINSEENWNANGKTNEFFSSPLLAFEFDRKNWEEIVCFSFSYLPPLCVRNSHRYTPSPYSVHAEHSTVYSTSSSTDIFRSSIERIRCGGRWHLCVSSIERRNSRHPCAVHTKCTPNRINNYLFFFLFCSLCSTGIKWSENIWIACISWYSSGRNKHFAVDGTHNSGKCATIYFGGAARCQQSSIEQYVSFGRDEWMHESFHLILIPWTIIIIIRCATDAIHVHFVDGLVFHTN